MLSLNHLDDAHSFSQPLLRADPALPLQSLPARRPKHPLLRLRRPLPKRKKMMQRLFLTQMNSMIPVLLCCRCPPSSFLPAPTQNPPSLHECRRPRYIPSHRQLRKLLHQKQQQSQYLPHYWLLPRRRACPWLICLQKQPKQPLSRCHPQLPHQKFPFPSRLRLCVRRRVLRRRRLTQHRPLRPSKRRNISI